MFAGGGHSRLKTFLPSQGIVVALRQTHRTQRWPILQFDAKTHRRKIGSALDKIDELHDSIADKLPEDMEEDLRALELGVHEAFDAMARNVQEAVKTMSEKDSEVHREHSKAAQKQFDKKLEQSRAAGKVALQNKSTELAANFKKEMQQQLADLKDGGGALLLEAQQAAEEAREELAQERLKHETSKETLESRRRRFSSWNRSFASSVVGMTMTTTRMRRSCCRCKRLRWQRRWKKDGLN